MTAITVFERLGIKPHFLYIEPRVALEKLRRGEIDALIAVEGRPIELLRQLDDQNLHLVPVDDVEPLQRDYLPAQFTAEDYPHLVGRDARVDTIAAAARAAIAIGGCRCWSMRCSERSRSCKSRPITRNGKR